MNRCVQEPLNFATNEETNMSDDIMADAMELFRSGDLKGAVENLDGKLRSNRDNAILQHTYAEFAHTKKEGAVQKLSIWILAVATDSSGWEFCQ